jgi:glycosyltransferase involved in cell wall biosynthesis
MGVADLAIVVPTLNSERYLPYTLLSLLQQANVAIEVLVVDGESTDSTRDIAARFGCRVACQRGGGMYAAVNLGVSLTTSNWVGYLNSDDLVYPHSYSRLIKCGERRDADLVYGSCDFIDDEGRFKFSFAAAGERSVQAVIRTGLTPFAQQTTIFRRDALPSPPFDAAYRLAADFKLFATLATTNRVFARCPGPPVAAFRLHSQQLSSAALDLAHQEHRRACSELGLNPSLHDRVHAWRWRALNWHSYVVRAVRSVSLRGRVRFSRTIERNAPTTDRS